MDDPLMHDHDVIIDWDAVDLEIGRQWRENSSLEKWFPFTAEQLATLAAENAALKERTERLERSNQWNDSQRRAWIKECFKYSDELAALKAQLAAAEPLSRPASFDFAMEFLGGPENDDVVAYVEQLERKLAANPWRGEEILRRYPEAWAEYCAKGAPGQHAAMVPEIPDVLFDGFSVYQAMADEAKKRTSPENMNDVLSAVVRLLRAVPAPKSEEKES